MTLDISKARPEDVDAVLALLSQASLPTEGVAEHFAHFLVARAGGKVVGAVGLEFYGASALLRSLVVAPEYRGHGLGKTLTERILATAGTHGVRNVFLLTATAGGFFPKFGFKRIAREEADPAVQESVEFRVACCRSEVCMRLDL